MGTCPILTTYMTLIIMPLNFCILPKHLQFCSITIWIWFITHEDIFMSIIELFFRNLLEQRNIFIFSFKLLSSSNSICFGNLGFFGGSFSYDFALILLLILFLVHIYFFLRSSYTNYTYRSYWGNKYSHTSFLCYD